MIEERDLQKKKKALAESIIAEDTEFLKKLFRRLVFHPKNSMSITFHALAEGIGPAFQKVFDFVFDGIHVAAVPQFCLLAIGR